MSWQTNLSAVQKLTSRIQSNLNSIKAEFKGVIPFKELFKMDSDMKKSALSMGLLSKETNGFYEGIKSASWETNQIGVNIEQLAKMQSDYADGIGRNVILTQDGLKAMSQLAVATGLGAEGAASMAADMENQGYSAERTRDFVEKTLNDSHKMGLNASKVVKNIQQNIKMLNKYNFKGGAKGLAKMAETTTKLGVDMNFAANMAEKLFDIEGAVDMSAQLQVMGGEWAKLADPFKLMYMARNDMEGLTAALGEAAKSAVHFNKKNGEFEISALEMHRLRKVAEQMGVSYDELAEAGKNAAKFTKIKSQMNFSLSGSKEDKELAEYLTNKSQFNEKGEAYINIDGTPKLIKTLSSADKTMLASKVAEKKGLEERAKAARTFDDALANTINGMKVFLLPIIETINQELLPKIDGFVKRFKSEKWGEKIAAFAGMVGKAISFFGGLILGFPKTFLLAIVASKVLSIGATIAGAASGIVSAFGAFSTAAPALAAALGPIAIGLAGVATALGAISFGKYLGGKVSEATGNKSTEEGDKAAWMAGLGLAVGAAAIAATGGLATPLVIAAAAGGGLAGGLGGKAIGDAMNQPTHDGLFEMGKNYGSDFSKGNAIVQNGTVTPIDNKDDLLAMKPNGIIDKSLKSKVEKPQIIKHIFDDVNINGTLMLSLPGGGNIPVEITKDPTFIRNLTAMIHSETEKAINGGKN